MSACPWTQNKSRVSRLFDLPSSRSFWIGYCSSFVWTGQTTSSRETTQGNRKLRVISVDEKTSRDNASTAPFLDSPPLSDSRTPECSRRAAWGLVRDCHDIINLVGKFLLRFGMKPNGRAADFGDAHAVRARMLVSSSSMVEIGDGLDRWPLLSLAGRTRAKRMFPDKYPTRHPPEHCCLVCVHTQECMI
ncbi:uncharacterized protein BKA78DRAFT_40235 [Phyllosticta capitalensis]|uniref:uncharacterized protein n=1 Tax=Phyllosticta capitalensis TaxID=121624 RepID=UPI00312F3A32